MKSAGTLEGTGIQNYLQKKKKKKKIIKKNQFQSIPPPLPFF